MANVLKTLRNHWKKSLFFSCVAAYGVHFGKNKYQDKQLMKSFCMEAKKYGEITVPVNYAPYHVTVVLNPAASGGKARTKFESYCAPLLHLAGIKVSVIRTEGEGQAKNILEVVADCDAVLIAGGDGTLMEAVTGWMRRHGDNRAERFKVPLGVLPVGKSNNFARNLFNYETDVRLMAEATMAVVRQLYQRPIDVIQVRNLSSSEELRGKKIYGLRQIEIGCFKDADARMGKYWIFAGLKKYVTYIFSYTTAAKEILWKVEGSIEKSDNRVAEEPISKAVRTLTWWEWIFGAKTSSISESSNTEVNLWEAIDDNFAGCELTFLSSNNEILRNEPGSKYLTASLGPKDVSFVEYLKEGWSRQRQNVSTLSDNWTSHQANSFRFTPLEEVNIASEKPKKFYLDNEAIEIVGQMEISLLPESILMFCSDTSTYNFKRPEDKSQSQRPWWRNTHKMQTMSKQMKLS